MSLVYPAGATAPVTAANCCQDCAEGTAVGAPASGYGWRLLHSCSGGSAHFVPGSGGVNFWTPMNHPGPGGYDGIYEYFKASCVIYTAPYRDTSGGIAFDGTVLDPLAPADQTQFWGMTNHQAASGSIGIFVQWMFARIPMLIPPATFYQSQTGLYNGQNSAENFFRAVDGEPGWGTCFPLENGGAGFLNVPNYGQWAIMNGVREGGGGIGGFPSGGWEWEEWYVNAYGLLIPGGDGTGGLWAGGDTPASTAAFACLPNVRQQRVSTTVEGWAVYG